MKLRPPVNRPVRGAAAPRKAKPFSQIRLYNTEPYILPKLNPQPATVPRITHATDIHAIGFLDYRNSYDFEE